MKKVVFASMNKKKTVEIQRMAPEWLEVICLKDIPEAANVSQADENGETFLDNATIKAMYWAEKLKCAVLAEDSGIMIDSLGGFPGVNTKRCIEQFYQGSDINEDTPAKLYPALLSLITKDGNKDTTANWVSAMVLVDGNNIIKAEEMLQGDMCSCAGEREFGFDQYFRPKELNNTLAELTPQEKDSIGPRKKAFYKILEQIK